MVSSWLQTPLYFDKASEEGDQQKHTHILFEDHHQCSNRKRLQGIEGEVHEVCSIATSMVLKKNFAANQVLWVGMGKYQTVFNTFYLSDVTYESFGALSVGPIAVAQRVVFLPVT